MKNISYLLLLTMFWSCSSFDEDVDLLTHKMPLTEIETDLAVINIIIDEDEFQEMYSKVDEEIEIAGSFNLYRNHELLIEEEEVELEIKGNKSKTFPLKTLGVKFEDKYDNRNRYLVNPEQVLPYHDIDKIKAIRLRNSGNDFNFTMLKDLSFTDLAIQAELDLDVTYGEPTLVYVNGDFYGLLNLRTEANTNGVAALHGVKKKKVTLAKVTTHELIKKDGDFDRIDALVDAIDRKDIDFIKKEIDVNNFIDYMVFQSYIGNIDWPHNNVRFYAIDGGKFRFILFDTDNASWLKMGKAPLTLIEDRKNPNVISDLFFALYEEESFKQAFSDRFKAVLQSGLISSDKFNAIVDENANRIRSEIELQIDKYTIPGTMTEWNIELDKLKALYQERESVVRRLME